jgi:hypothetical protein
MSCAPVPDTATKKTRKSMCGDLCPGGASCKDGSFSPSLPKLRGGTGKPYRQPAGGWPALVLPYGSFFQHKNPALNGLAKFVNTTSIRLQENQVGRPMTRAVSPLSGTCESELENGLPKETWIGLGVDQFLPSQLPGLNQFTQQGTNDKGNKCRLRGGKWVQAIRNHHGVFGFLSHDPAGCSDVICTDTSRNHESPQPTPDQTKYLTINATATLTMRSVSS